MRNARLPRRHRPVLRAMVSKIPKMPPDAAPRPYVSNGDSSMLAIGFNDGLAALLAFAAASRAMAAKPASAAATGEGGERQPLLFGEWLGDAAPRLPKRSSTAARPSAPPSDKFCNAAVAPARAIGLPACATRSNAAAPPARNTTACPSPGLATSTASACVASSCASRTPSNRMSTGTTPICAIAATTCSPIAARRVSAAAARRAMTTPPAALPRASAATSNCAKAGTPPATKIAERASSQPSAKVARRPAA
mmetsp:Transcript_71639/g.207458  ORF Transcript_71639/g.207458 Transcript_71639/m.207458 type:complete len:252 (-) Transcript_71639:1320-2075(-)